MPCLGSRPPPLLAAGAKIDPKDDTGRTPLYLAALEGHDKLVELLASKGADVNTKDRDGQTALSIASKRHHQAVVDMLLKHGAGK
jgi:ankyrin repeat protein